MDRDEERALKRIERRRYEYARVIEMIRATTAMEHAALRSPFLLNGGALIVYFAIYGSMLARGAPDKFVEPWPKVAMAIWVIGLIAATVATATAFRSQWAFRQHRVHQVRTDASLEDAEGATEREDKSEVKTLLYVARKDDAQSSRNEREGNTLRTIATWSVVASVALFILGIGAAFVSLPRA